MASNSEWGWTCLVGLWCALLCRLYTERAACSTAEKKKKKNLPTSAEWKEQEYCCWWWSWSPSVYLYKGHVSFKYTKVRPLELINVPAEYPLENEDLSWKAQLEGVSLEKHTWETCCEEEKLNIHEQPGFEGLFLSPSLRFLWGHPQCLRPRQGGNCWDEGDWVEVVSEMKLHLYSSQFSISFTLNTLLWLYHTWQLLLRLWGPLLTPLTLPGVSPTGSTSVCKCSVSGVSLHISSSGDFMGEVFLQLPIPQLAA